MGRVLFILGSLLSLTIVNYSSALLDCDTVAHAERLSVRHYEDAESLAASNVKAIYQDSKGYIWFGMSGGLSRFDGYRFKNYQEEDGLGHQFVNAITEDREGRLWVATNGGGVARLVDSFDELTDPARAGKKFINYSVGFLSRSNQVNSLLFDANNTLWCATDDGLYRVQASGNLALEFELIATGSYRYLFADSQGGLWVSGFGNGLFRIIQGQLAECGPGHEISRYPIRGLAQDSNKKLLVANLRGLFEIEPQLDSSNHVEIRQIPLALKPGQHIHSLATESDGTVWVGTTQGLMKLKEGRQSLYTRAEGLSGNEVERLYRDREGNLWISITDGGISKLSTEAIVSFSTEDGLPNNRVAKIIEGRNKEVYAVTHDGNWARITDIGVIRLLTPYMPKVNDVRSSVIFSRHRNWVTVSGEGVFSFKGDEPASGPRQEILPFDDPSWQRGIVYEDPSGVLWCGVRNTLFRLDPGQNGVLAVERISLESDLPDHTILAVTTDQAGAMWIATHTKVGRIANGKFAELTATTGLPDTQVRAFFLDSRGWLWLGLRYKGISVTKNPSADRPEFINYSLQQGLLDAAVSSITEDDFGRIYVGTGHGIALINPDNMQVRTFGVMDGLAGPKVNHCVKDSQGNIWVATNRGVSRFSPGADELIARRPPPIYISRVQVAGVDLPIPETGALRIPLLELSASQNNLLIEYVGLSFRSEKGLKYQYMLEGNDRDWSAPGEQRSLNFARLAPGDYRLFVRAIGEDGMMSEVPAEIEFRILSPLWQRWWFMAAAALLLGLAVYLIYRYRVSHLLEVERVRTRISTDLHDDIGSNLSRIAILSEIVSHEVSRDNPQVKEPLSVIATSSRELVDSMSDIVWAINPKKDHLEDMVQRMRRFANDVFTAQNIEARFIAPASEAHLKLGVDVRRQVFLIFREGVNNIARHSDCTEVRIELRIEGGWLSLTLKDNGKGFDPDRFSDGNGLKNMTARAKNLGGRLEVISSVGGGTTLILKAPLVVKTKPSNNRRR